MDISEFLQIPAMTLATCSREGGPHAAPVYFAAGEGLRLYFFSEPGSQHGQDLEHDPQAAAALFPETTGWQDIRGLQLRGLARTVPLGAEWEAAWGLYLEKFPFVSELKKVVARNTLYAFIPHWARLLDNRRGFGFKLEWVPGQGEPRA